MTTIEVNTFFCSHCLVLQKLYWRSQGGKEGKKITRYIQKRNRNEICRNEKKTKTKKENPNKIKKGKTKIDRSSLNFFSLFIFENEDGQRK